MSTVEEIEAAIEKLPLEQYQRLQEWFKVRLEDEWDRQFEEDARSNRLDHATREAVAQYRAGMSTPFPPDAK